MSLWNMIRVARALRRLEDKWNDKRKPKEKLTRPYHQFPDNLWADFQMDYKNDIISSTRDLDKEYWIKTKQDFMLRGYLTFGMTNPRNLVCAHIDGGGLPDAERKWRLFASTLRELNVTRLAKGNDETYR